VCAYASQQDGAAIVERGGLVLLEVAHPSFALARDELSPFTELVKAPEGLHTLRLTPLSVWNAIATGLTASEIVTRLQRHARLGVPGELEACVREWASRYGAVVLLPGETRDRIDIDVRDAALLARLLEDQELRTLLEPRPTVRATAPAADRGRIKQALVRLGFPARDRAGYAQATPLGLELRPTTTLRPYQREALAALLAAVEGGSGVVCMPCGAGKTLTGLAKRRPQSSETA
jgi:DNA excision repair protein ERCC-3